jgi:flagellar motor protein MotB
MDNAFAGFADSRPLAEGDSAEARAKSGRIELTVVPART